MQNLIHKIRLSNQVVTIPGFHNANEFTTVNQKAIQNELELWQLFDGIILSRWIDGLNGKTKIDPATLEKMMNELYQYVEVKHKIAYQKLQIKGITSHAWLVVSMKTMPHGYELEVIDSNAPTSTQIYAYKIGDDSFFIKGYGNFVPYLEYTKEEERLVNVGKAFCGANE
jgi:hypothetical protein